MTTTLVVPEGFAWIAPSLIAVQLLTTGLGAVVMRHRAKAKIAYPQLYAEKAEMAASPAAFKFNCAQRVHQNALEAAPMVTAFTVIMGLSYPKAAAITCATWVFGRVFYSIGYISSPDKRYRGLGVTGYLAQCVLKVGAIMSAVKLLGYL